MTSPRSVPSISRRNVPVAIYDVTVLPITSVAVRDLDSPTQRVERKSLLELLPVVRCSSRSPHPDEEEVDLALARGGYHLEIAQPLGEDVPSRDEIFVAPARWRDRRRFWRNGDLAGGQRRYCRWVSSRPADRSRPRSAAICSPRTAPPTLILFLRTTKAARAPRGAAREWRLPACGRPASRWGRWTAGSSCPRCGCSPTTRSSAGRAGCAGTRRSARPRLPAVTGAAPARRLPVVHLDHGIGIYRGIQTLTVGDGPLKWPSWSTRAAIASTFRSTVSTNSSAIAPAVMMAIARRPRSISSAARRGRRCARKTRQAVQTMAAELLDLYAAPHGVNALRLHPTVAGSASSSRRSSTRTRPTSAPPRKTTIEADMERPKPMDRLLVGDVGYGKTEVAVRAAFKAVQGGKQVAVLVPTTILAEQHFRTFSDRLADYPVKVEALSRFRTAKEQRRRWASWRRGELDIVIGTHRLLSKDVLFKDLGLSLVVDEEHRFGVKHKERLPGAPAGGRCADALTATPIPRTLHLSLAGLRDMTVIETAPRDRPAIPHLRRALGRCPARRGDGARARSRRAGVRGAQPDRDHRDHRGAGSRTGAARPGRCGSRPDGRRRSRERDAAVRGGWARCAGLDDDRGIGARRSECEHDDRSRCPSVRPGAALSASGAGGPEPSPGVLHYLVVPDTIDQTADERLQGARASYRSGGRVSDRAAEDLELRGAGNLLGSEQSGHAQAVGFDLYMRWLEETVTAMRGQGGRGRHPSRPTWSSTSRPISRTLSFRDDETKLDLCRRLARASAPGDIDELRAELRERFGPRPGGGRCLAGYGSLARPGCQARGAARPRAG